MTTRTRVMLTMLGLGLEQTTTFLAQTRPSPGEFRRLQMQTARLPPAEALGRYIALVRGETIPSAAKDRIDPIDRMRPLWMSMNSPDGGTAAMPCYTTHRAC